MWLIVWLIVSWRPKAMLRLAQGVGSLALQYALPRAAEALPAVAAAAARAVSGRGFSRYRTASGSMLDEPAMSAPKQVR